MAAASREHGAPVDLLHAPERLIEASVSGSDREWVLVHAGRTVKIDDVFRRTLPASPPSRLRYRLGIPKGAVLSFSYGIPEDRHGRPGVEFVVKVRRGDREDTVWTSLLDPIARPAHRRWVPAMVDVSRWAGADADLILETRGYEAAEDRRGAFWATPALTVTGVGKFSAATAARIFSATRRPSSSGVSGSSTTNSSPPKRATKSDCRVLRCKTRAMRCSTSSPA